MYYLHELTVMQHRFQGVSDVLHDAMVHEAVEMTARDTPGVFVCGVNLRNSLLWALVDILHIASEEHSGYVRHAMPSKFTVCLRLGA